MEEIWRWIDGYKNMYQVSNLGRVRSVDRYVYCEVSPNKLQHIFGKVLKPGFNHKGYPIVYLSKDGKQKTIAIHRLVAKAFIDNPLSLPQVNHKDGCKTNNCVDNLEWCDNSYNQKHAWESGLQPSYEESNGRGRPARAVAMLDLNTGEVLRTFETLASVKRETGINQFNVRSVCLGLRNHAGGYDWKFINEGDDE
jgi:hypothetical protein